MNACDGGEAEAEGAPKASSLQRKWSRNEGSTAADHRDLGEGGTEAPRLRHRRMRWPVAQQSPDWAVSEITQRGSRNYEA